jgi:hypothetical protein
MQAEKIYNIGVTKFNGEHVGFRVAASNGDEAYRSVLEYCNNNGTRLLHGHTMQFRDAKNNEWFDREFPAFTDLILR